MDIWIEGLRLRRRLLKTARNIIFGKTRNLAREYLTSAGTIGLVVHVGAHLGQEAEAYRGMGATRVIWIEGDPDIYKRLVRCLQSAEADAERPVEHTAICALVSDQEGKAVAFHRFNNDGASSSMYLPTKCSKDYWPGLDAVGCPVELRTRTLEAILDEVGIEQPANGKSLLVLDVQGHELGVLAGIGRYACAFDLCECEVSKEEIYKGGALYPEVRATFESLGYAMISHSEENVPWHGDVIFARNTRIAS